MKAQIQQVLEMLIWRGKKGINSFEFYNRFLPRGAAIIHKLSLEGYPIVKSGRHSNGSVTYFLLSEELDNQLKLFND